MEVRLPPLRERKEDIPLLVDHFLKKFNERFRKEIVSVSSEVGVFDKYSRPGNVELEHALERAFITCSQPTITVDHLPAGLTDFPEDEAVSDKEKTAPGREAIVAALQRTGGNKARRRGFSIQPKTITERSRVRNRRDGHPFRVIRSRCYTSVPWYTRRSS
jgi:DNA-binding NtrC family response regulator